MDNMKWIKSGGGPLILMERPLLPAWRGVLGTKEPTELALQSTDYKRASARMSLYASTLNVGGGEAIVIGDIPMLTAVYLSESMSAVISICYAPTEFSVENYLSELPTNNLPEEVSSIKYRTKECDLVLFDSAFPGDQLTDETIEFGIPKGSHRILTHILEDVPEVSLLLHRFVSPLS